MKKTQSLKFLALSLIIGAAGFLANAWANDNVKLNGTTIFDDGGLKFKVTDFNKSTMEAEVEVSGNALDKDCDEIDIPESFTRIVEGKWNGSPVKGEVKFTVTAIGQDAFMDLPKVKEIKIPGTVKEIADDAFDNCGNMATVEFGPNSQLTTLGDAMWGVSSISEIDFSNCHNLDLSTGTPFIPRNGTVNNQLKKVILPAEIENIGVAFANCPKLETLDLSNTKVVTLEEGALENDAALKSITFPAVAGKTLLIEDDAMCGSNITEITINTNMTTGSLTASSFAGIALEKVTINGELLGEASIPANVFVTPCNNKMSKNTLKTLIFNGDILAENAIATDAACGLNKLSTLTFNNNIYKNGIQTAAFTGNSADAPCTISFNGVLAEGAIGAYAFQNSYLAKVTFEKDINSAAIANHAFYNNKTKVENVEVLFKGRLTASNAIGESAFENSGNSGIGKLTFEKEIVAENAIAKDAFKNAGKIQTITFKEAIKKTNAIDETAFAGAGKNAKLYIEDITEPEAINSTAFNGASIQSIEINNLHATQAIAPSQFEGITALNTLTINCDLTYEDMIGAGAFAGTTNMTGITLKGDITMPEAIVADSEGDSPFAGSGANKTTTLTLDANKIVTGGIGAFAFANSGVNIIKLNNAATDLQTNAFAANSFKGIPTEAKIYYSPAAANVKDHNFVISAFNPEFAPVDILFYTNDAVKYSYEKTEVRDVTPYRIKFILGIEVDLTKGADGYYYGAWVPQDEMYVIDKYQQGTEVFVYSAYYDDKTINPNKVGTPDYKDYNKLYMNPLRVQDNGKYVLNAGEALLIRVKNDIELIAKQNYETDKDGNIVSLTPKYQFGGIQTFAGLNVRQCNDFRFTPWQIYKAAVENDLEDIYGNKVSDYLIIRQVMSSGKEWTFQAANAIPANYLYVLGTSDLAKRQSYSSYDGLTDEDFDQPWMNYNDSWLNNFKKVLKAYGELTSTLQTKEELIKELRDEIEELKTNNKTEELQGVIEGLEGVIEALEGCHEDDIELMIRLIDTRDAIRDAKDALAAAGNNTAEDVADVEAVAAAKEALEDAKAGLADATAAMENFTLGSIYLKMDAALPYVLAAAQPLKDYNAALATWQEKHQAYLDKVEATQDGKDVETTTVLGKFLPVKVLSNFDADGNVIPGFEKTYYIKVTEEVEQILAQKGFLTEVPVEEEADEDAAGARMAIDPTNNRPEPAGGDITPTPTDGTDVPTETETTPFNLLSERVELYTKAEATDPTAPEVDPNAVSARIVGLQGEAEEIGEFTATGIFVEVGEITQPDGDYAFKSYGMKSTYDLLNEMAEGEDATAPAQIQVEGEVTVPSSGAKVTRKLFEDEDGNIYFWAPAWQGYINNESGVMAEKSITLSPKMRTMTLADFMTKNGIAEADMALPEDDDDDDIAGGIRFFEGNDEQLINEPGSGSGSESGSASGSEEQPEEQVNPYAEYLVWKDLENNPSDTQPLDDDDDQQAPARLAAPGEFNQYSDAIFEKDGKFYQIVEGETADSYKLVLIEEEASEKPTNVWAAGSVKLVKNPDGTIADPINLGGMFYYPVTIVTNFKVDTTIDPETGEKTETVTETEIEGYTGKEDFYYVAAEDVTKDGEIVESATGIKLLQKKQVEQTYPNPVEWTGIYVDLKATPELEGDLAFRSFGEKYNSWDVGKDDVAFATGTVEIVKLLGEDNKPVVVEVEVEGETGDETKKQSNFVAAIETVEETKTEFVPADPESYTYEADDECEMCSAAEELKEAAAALCEAAKNLSSEDEDDPCADLKNQLEEATTALEELTNSGVDIDQYLTALWEELRAAEWKWHNDKVSALSGDETITEAVLAADEQEVARIKALYDAKYAEYEKHQKDLKEAKDLVDDLSDLLDDCEKASNSNYIQLSEEELTRLMEELEIAIMNHLTWTDSEGDEYHPTEDTTVEKEALQNFLHAKYGEDCTPYSKEDDEDATPFIERVAVVPTLEKDLADATAAAIEVKDAADLEAAEDALADAIAAHEAVQNEIEAKEDLHYAYAPESESRNITVIWNDKTDDVTGIMEAVVAKSGRVAESDGAIYNLQGIKVENAQKGVFIQNGKKVVK